MAYSDKVLDHYENPRNVGKLDDDDANVGTGMVGAPACGDVMRLQIKVDDEGVIEDAKFKTYGCGSAIASSSLLTEWVKGRSLDQAKEIKNKDIPIVKLGDETKLRVIAGNYQDIRGPSNTFTDINIYDITSKNSKDINLNYKNNTNTLILIMSGELKIENKLFKENNILIFERNGEYINFNISKNFKGLILNSEPIDEPIVAHGPFIMNTKEEIIEAIEDFQNGKMGNLFNN